MTDDRKPMANIPPFGLRMQPDLKARIEDAARANNRSLNAEIIARLESTLERDDTLTDHERRLEALESKIADVEELARLANKGQY